MKQLSIGRGFTLIELLVVIAIIAILAAILFPVFARAREKARQSTCMSNQRQIAIAAHMYAMDHNTTMPPKETFWSDIKLGNEVMICPSLGKNIPNAYGYNAAMDNSSLGSVADPAATVLTGDALTSVKNILNTAVDLGTPHSNGFLVSGVDGHVSYCSLKTTNVDALVLARFNPLVAAWAVSIPLATAPVITVVSGKNTVDITKYGTQGYYRPYNSGYPAWRLPSWIGNATVSTTAYDGSGNKILSAPSNSDTWSTYCQFTGKYGTTTQTENRYYVCGSAKVYEVSLTIMDQNVHTVMIPMAFHGGNDNNVTIRVTETSNPSNTVSTNMTYAALPAYGQVSFRASQPNSTILVREEFGSANGCNGLWALLFD
ncbi:MAG: prepilin-type N-terminal cleavage/methylation domain-containing protein [bacterium]